MSLISRLLARFRPSAMPPRPLAGADVDDLVKSAERLIQQAVIAYKPLDTSMRPSFHQAEYAPFCYFWVQHWHDQQPKEVSGYDKFTRLLSYPAQQPATAIAIYGMAHMARGWDPDAWFFDRVRLYSHIARTESQKVSGGPPPLFVACHLLGTYSQKTRSLEIRPDLHSSSDVLSLCLSQSMFGDALEQLHLFETAKAAFQDQLQKICDIAAELHYRRLANR